MNIRWRYIFLSLALSLLIGLAYLYPAYLHAYIIKPITGILWLAYRTLSAVSQEIYWALLILTTLILSIGMIPNQTEGHDRLAYQCSIHENNRVAYWRALLKSAEESGNDRLTLQRELEALNQSIGVLVEDNKEEDILLPPFRNNIQRRIRLAWMSFSLPRFIHRKEVHKTTELEKHVDFILKSMETQLEVHHAQESNQINDD